MTDKPPRMLDDPSESESVKELLQAGVDDPVSGYNFEQGLATHLSQLAKGTPAPPWAEQIIAGSGRAAGTGAAATGTAVKGATATGLTAKVLVTWVGIPIATAGVIATVMLGSDRAEQFVSEMSAPTASEKAEPVAVSGSEIDESDLVLQMPPLVEPEQADDGFVQQQEPEPASLHKARHRKREIPPSLSGIDQDRSGTIGPGPETLADDTEALQPVKAPSLTGTSSGSEVASPVPGSDTDYDIERLMESARSADRPVKHEPFTGRSRPGTSQETHEPEDLHTRWAKGKQLQPEKPVAPEQSDESERQRLQARLQAEQEAEQLELHEERQRADLQKEMQMLAAASRLLESDPKRALRLARAGEKLFPGSMFSEERRHLLILALIQLDRMDEARGVAEPYLRRYPNSPYAKRIRRALATGRIE